MNSWPTMPVRRGRRLRSCSCEQPFSHGAVDVDSLRSCRLETFSSSVCATRMLPARSGRARPGRPESRDVGRERDHRGGQVRDRVEPDGGDRQGLARLDAAGRGLLIAARMGPASPTRRMRISARALSEITLGARPPEMVPMFRLPAPSTGSWGMGMRRIFSSTSRSFSMAESPSSG